MVAQQGEVPAQPVVRLGLSQPVRAGAVKEKRPLIVVDGLIKITSPFAENREGVVGVGLLGAVTGQGGQIEGPPEVDNGVFELVQPGMRAA